MGLLALGSRPLTCVTEPTTSPACPSVPCCPSAGCPEAVPTTAGGSGAHKPSNRSSRVRSGLRRPQVRCPLGKRTQEMWTKGLGRNTKGPGIEAGRWGQPRAWGGWAEWVACGLRGARDQAACSRTAGLGHTCLNQFFLKHTFPFSDSCWV